MPLVLLGALLRALARQGVAPPWWLGVALAVWGGVSTLVMPPSSFVLVPVLAALLGWRR